MCVGFYAHICVHTHKAKVIGTPAWQLFSRPYKLYLKEKEDIGFVTF